MCDSRGLWFPAPAVGLFWQKRSALLGVRRSCQEALCSSSLCSRRIPQLGEGNSRKMREDPETTHKTSPSPAATVLLLGGIKCIPVEHGVYTIQIFMKISHRNNIFVNETLIMFMAVIGDESIIEQLSVAALH